MRVERGTSSETTILNSLFNLSFTHTHVDLRMSQDYSLLDALILFTASPSPSNTGLSQTLLTRLATD